MVFSIHLNKESACSVGDPGSIPGSGRFPGEGNGNPFQYSSLENPVDRGAWQATVHGVTKESDTTKGLSTIHITPQMNLKSITLSKKRHTED